MQPGPFAAIEHGYNGSRCLASTSRRLKSRVSAARARPPKVAVSLIAKLTMPLHSSTVDIDRCGTHSAVADALSSAAAGSCTGWILESATPPPHRNKPITPDIARCHAKRHHVEHAGFPSSHRAAAGIAPASATAPRAAATSALDRGGVVRLGRKSRLGDCEPGRNRLDELLVHQLRPPEHHQTSSDGSGFASPRTEYTAGNSLALGPASAWNSANVRPDSGPGR
jgi:hypothetical protein